MKNDTKWLEKSYKYLMENDGADLYFILEMMYKEEKMMFLHFIYKASKGYGCGGWNGLSYLLDQDYDDPQEFNNQVCFSFYDDETSIISAQHFVQLMQVVSASYIETHPNDKAAIEMYLNKLKERYL